MRLICPENYGPGFIDDKFVIDLSSFIDCYANFVLNRFMWCQETCPLFIAAEIKHK